MMYINKRYIGTAWESEMRHHQRTIGQLRIKIEKLAKELAWELEQHHTRLLELESLDSPLSPPLSVKSPEAREETRERGLVRSGNRKKLPRPTEAIHPFVEPEFVG